MTFLRNGSSLLWDGSDLWALKIKTNHCTINACQSRVISSNQYTENQSINVCVFICVMTDDTICFIEQFMISCPHYCDTRTIEPCCRSVDTLKLPERIDLESFPLDKICVTFISMIPNNKLDVSVRAMFFTVAFPTRPLRTTSVLSVLPQSS